PLLAGGGERERRPRARGRGACAPCVRGSDDEAAAASSVRADGLEKRSRILGVVAGAVAVACSGNKQDSMVDRILDRTALDGGRAVAGEAQIDDLRSAADGVGDRLRLVDVRERAVGTAGLDDQQPCVATESDDSGADLDRAPCEPGDLSAGAGRPVPVASLRSRSMAATNEEGRTSVRVELAGRGESSAATGVPALDHLLALLAEYASFDLVLEVAPGRADAEVAAA